MSITSQSEHLENRVSVTLDFFGVEKRRNFSRPKMGLFPQNDVGISLLNDCGIDGYERYLPLNYSQFIDDLVKSIDSSLESTD